MSVSASCVPQLPALSGILLIAPRPTSVPLVPFSRTCQPVCCRDNLSVAETSCPHSPHTAHPHTHVRLRPCPQTPAVRSPPPHLTSFLIYLPPPPQTCTHTHTHARSCAHIAPRKGGKRAWGHLREQGSRVPMSARGRLSSGRIGGEDSKRKSGRGAREGTLIAGKGMRIPASSMQMLCARLCSISRISLLFWRASLRSAWLSINCSKPPVLALPIEPLTQLQRSKSARAGTVPFSRASCRLCRNVKSYTRAMY